MPSNNLLLMGLAGLLTLVGLGVAVLVGVEVVRLARDLLARPPERPGGRLAARRQAGASPTGDTGPLRTLDPDKYRDRETVERLIEHFGGDNE